MKTGLILLFLVSLTVYPATITVELPDNIISTCYLPVTSTGVIPQMQGAYPGVEAGFPYLP
ncbi:MAG: hypothetical protein KAT47_02040, partial [Candidatus Aegiribacteria sp.]|nr:hypothetical protein [Candidatus Aegiribacteria sp.]